MFNVFKSDQNKKTMPTKLLKNKLYFTLIFSFLSLVFFTNQAKACSAPSLTITKNGLSVSITYKATDSQGLGAISLSHSLATKNPIDAPTCANGNYFPTTCSSSWSGNFNAGTTVKFTASASCKDSSHMESSQTITFPAAPTTTTPTIKPTTPTIPTCSGPTSQACTPKLPDNAVSCSASTQDRVCTSGKWGEWNECKATFCVCLIPDYKWDEVTKSCISTALSPLEKLKEKLNAMKIPAAEIEKLIGFAITHNVPYEKLNSVADKVQKMPNSDPLTYLNSFAVAYFAVKYDLIDGKYAPIVDYFENGKIDVAKGNAGGNAGQYSPRANILTIGNDLTDIEDVFNQTTVIHELIHAYHDATKSTASWQDNEVEAYIESDKYYLLMDGTMKKTNGGTTFNNEGYYLVNGIGRENIHYVFRAMAIIESARTNVQNGKNDLNNLTINTADGKNILLSKMNPADVIKFTDTALGFAQDSVREQWRKTTKEFNYEKMGDEIFYEFATDPMKTGNDGLKP
jgi:hypothetical protein